ncbi:MAG: complex I subunit 1 family protein [Promethearchaeati archaeon SRVP18_Atabeyarchaeia-1]
MAIEILFYFRDLFLLFVFPGIVFCIGYSLFLEWIYRKFFADLQNRIGPKYTGPRGVLQPLADFIKLMAKEDIVPKGADHLGFTATPILMLTLSLTALLLVPISGLTGLISFQGDLIFAIFLMTLMAISIVLAGWFSANRFSETGSARAGMQLVGYEIPLTLALISPAIIAGRLDIAGILSYQTTHVWLIEYAPLAFGIFMICLLAELEKLPFDIPEAHTEIVAGWLTEFSGKKYAFFHLSNDLEMLFGAGLAVALFLGGPAPPVSILAFGVGLEWLTYSVWFMFKTFLLVLLFSGISALLGRWRIDQMIRGSWRYLIPLSVAQLVLIELLMILRFL